MIRHLMAAAIAFAPLPALAEAAHGTWATEANDEGSYLHVDIGPCAANGALTCGVIAEAMTPDGPNDEYEHLGRLIIENMQADGANYTGGTIWAPDDDRTYRSNMELSGNVLAVEGCVLVFCRGQNWTRVQ
ncbi:MAG: DUF2147 domain-containing protein [Rubricella sp.]